MTILAMTIILVNRYHLTVAPASCVLPHALLASACKFCQRACGLYS